MKGAPQFWVGPDDDPDRYRLEEAHSSGADGQVWRGKLRLNGHVVFDVAVKIINTLHQEAVADWGRRAEQVELLRSLHHPGLVPLREAFDGPRMHPAGHSQPNARSVYVVMNWIEGESLSEWTGRRPERDVSDALRLLTQIADALDYLHSGRDTRGKPIVHGDIKPDNIIVVGEAAVLVGLDLLRGQPAEVVVRPGLGTVSYLAPEIVTTGAYTPESDRYAFGCLAYLMLTKQDPPPTHDIGVMRARLATVPAFGADPSLLKRFMTILDPEATARPQSAMVWLQAVRSGALIDRERWAEIPAPAPLGASMTGRAAPDGNHVVALDDDVQFTVYRPRVIRPARWYSMLVFAHRTALIEDADGTLIDPVEAVHRQAQMLLLEQAVPFDAVSTDSPRLKRGTELLFEPWLEQSDVNPARAFLRWEEPIHRVEFRLRTAVSTEGRRLRGGVRVFRSGFLIGEVTFHVSVSGTAPVRTLPKERFTARRYRKIFASYSHNDSDVVELVSDYVQATGDRYLIDVRTLRSGEMWATRLEELIRGADLFQLFWSRNSMASEFVRQEWEYAIGLGRDGFIRPVYWELPLPTDQARGLPPETLRRLHFSRLPLRSIDDTAERHLLHPEYPGPSASLPLPVPQGQAWRPEVPARGAGRGDQDQSCSAPLPDALEASPVGQRRSWILLMTLIVVVVCLWLVLAITR